jgi:hypothetical protein
MESAYVFALIAGLAIGAVHYRRQARGQTGLPPGHPRRRRAVILFPFLVSFVVLALFAWSAGTDGTPGIIALVGFGLWFVVLFAVNKQIPREAEIRAYEVAHPAARQAAAAPRHRISGARPAAAPQPQPMPPLRLFDTDALREAAAARAAADEAVKALESRGGTAITAQGG